MSEAHRRRATLVPGIRVWTTEEDELVRTLPIAEAARRTERTVNAVISRRHMLGVPDGRRREAKLKSPLEVERIQSRTMR